MLAATVLAQMQDLLARLYDAPVEHDVRDFLITDRRDLTCQAGSEALTDEQLVIVEQPGEPEVAVRLALYVDAAVVARLQSANPFQRLDASNLADYCTAFEGVSHFHYVAWSAERSRRVSLLELELQAEVDKYAGALSLLTMQSGGCYPFTLHRDLFERVSYAGGLDEAHLHRYRLANHEAARFCRQLDDRYLRKRRVRAEAWVGALRRFYRSGQGEKLSQTASHAA